MRLLLPLFLVSGLALALSGCASSRSTPAPAASTAPAGQSASDAELSDLAQKLHSPRLMARVLLKQAREKKDASRAFKAAVFAFKAGDDDLAEQAAGVIEKLEPDSAFPAYIRLRTALDACKVDKAAEQAKRVYAQGGVRPLAQLAEAPYDDWCVYGVVKRVVAANPEDPELQQFFAHAALAAGDDGAALEAADKAEALGLDDLVVHIVKMQAQWGLGERDAALKLGAKLVAAHSRDPVVRSLYAGLLTRHGDYRRAREVLDDGAALTPGNAHIEIAYALLEQAQGQDKQARKRLTKLLEQGETSGGLYYLLGSDAQEQKDWNQAFVWYASAQDDASAQVAAANALRHWKGPEAAQKFLERLRHDEPGLDPLWQGTEAGMLDAEGKSAQAYAQLEKAVEQYPVVRALRYQRALLADQLGKTRVAMRELAALVKAEPRNPDYLNAYGYVLTEHTTDYEKARGYVEKALKADPDDPAILDSMGWVLFKAGRPGQALPYLKRARAATDDATIAAHLARVYIALGDRDAARSLVKAALAKYPDDAELKRLGQQLPPAQ